MCTGEKLSGSGSDECDEATAYKFYKRAFEKFAEHYHAFDPMSHAIVNRFVTIILCYPLRFYFMCRIVG